MSGDCASEKGGQTVRDLVFLSAGICVGATAMYFCERVPGGRFRAPPTGAADATLAASVRARLADILSHPGDIAVEVSDGVVTLRGTLTLAETHLVRSEVRKLPGVRALLDVPPRSRFALTSSRIAGLAAGLAVLVGSLRSPSHAGAPNRAQQPRGAGCPSVPGLLAFLVCVALSLPGLSQTPLIERGKQLTEQVAKCQACHTPRTPAGDLDKGAWLRGTPADPSPAPPGKAPVRIPDITPEGTLWMLWGEQGMLRFLEKGTSPSGATPSTHMPAYRLRHDDAEAIVAYLKSLRRK